jgi:choice-of-anchor A domain-containing protein
VKGTAPNRRFIVTWENMLHYYERNPNGRTTVQLKLFEGTNNIELHLVSGFIPNYYYYYATMGIENWSGTSGIQALRTQSSSGPRAMRFNAGPVSQCGNGIVESGEQCDGGSCCTGSCTFIASGTVCRSSAGICDVAEVCSGSSGACPTNQFQSSSTPCQEDFGVCDSRLARNCPGNSAQCSGLPVPTLNTGFIKFTGYNVISFNNFVANTGSVGGRLAAKNDVTLGQGFSVGYDLEDDDIMSPSPVVFSLISGHDLSWAGGGLYPSTETGKVEWAFVGDSFTGASYLAERIGGNATTAGRYLDADFDTARNYYASISDNLALEANNVVVTEQWSGLFLTCNSNTATRHVATVDGAVFGRVSWYSLEGCNAAATWIINVGGSGAVDLNGGNFPGIAERVLYNILGSGRTVSSSSGVAGNILAPRHTFQQTGGVTHGLVIAGDITAALSTSNPNCEDFAAFTINTVSTGAVEAGSTRVPVAGLSSFVAGDTITIQSSGEEATIDGLLMVDGQPTLELSAALANPIDEGSFIEGTVSDANTPRPSQEITEENTESNSGAAVVASVAVVAIALIA